MNFGGTQFSLEAWGAQEGGIQEILIQAVMCIYDSSLTNNSKALQFQQLKFSVIHLWPNLTKIMWQQNQNLN